MTKLRQLLVSTFDQGFAKQSLLATSDALRGHMEAFTPGAQ